ncbi:MAG: hypothetical protein M3409_08245 [Gemmatimonadota bacterium]|jgi:hypothetical protein|nr:hypothetical protein [Gemmatimonadota bacterium]
MTLPRHRPLCSALLGILLLSVSAHAQQVTLVEPLHVVRVQSAPFDGVGYVSETEASSMLLLSRGRNDRVTVPFATVTSLDLRRPNTPRQGAVRWGKRGLVVGTAAFVAAYGLGQLFGDVGAFRDVQWGPTAALFILGGGAGGAAYGALQPGGRWEPVSPPVRLRIVR